jgi:hypothetical protein
MGGWFKFLGKLRKEYQLSSLPAGRQVSSIKIGGGDFWGLGFEMGFVLVGKEAIPIQDN